MSHRAALPRLLVFGILVFGACSGSQSAGLETEGPATSEVVTALMRDALADPAGFSYEALVARLGSPVRTRTGAGTGAVDTLRTLVYYGVEFLLHESPGQVVLGAMALTDARYTSPEGLRVGYAQDVIRRELGPPSREDTGRLVYERTDPRPVSLVLLLEDRAVSRIEWVFGGK